MSSRGASSNSIARPQAPRWVSIGLGLTVAFGAGFVLWAALGLATYLFAAWAPVWMGAR